MNRLPLKFAVKCLVTAGLLWLAFRKVDLGSVSSVLAGLDPWPAAAALLGSILIIVADATLLSVVLRIFERSVPFATALLYSLVGWFFGNLAPSTVGGDIFRGVQLSRSGVPAGAAARLIISIRFLSFATLVAVMLAGLPIAFGLTQRRDSLVLTGIFAAASGALATILLLAHFPRGSRLGQWPPLRKLFTLSDDFRRLLKPGSRTALAWLAALVQHLLRVAILAILAAGLGLGVPLATLFALTPAALLIAMVPISIGGFGPRELTFVYLLGTAGVSAEAALSLSIAFGLLRVFVGTIGGVIWSLMSDHHYSVDHPSA
ncbi:MAG: lysylphosphatidylglycerol synthase transmembrane domain-containing protein [Sphingomicrobium sp.]